MPSRREVRAQSHAKARAQRPRRPVLRSGPAVLALVVGLGAGVGAGVAVGDDIVPHRVAPPGAQEPAAPQSRSVVPETTGPVPAAGPAPEGGTAAVERTEEAPSRSLREPDVTTPDSLVPVVVPTAPEVPDLVLEPEPVEPVEPAVDPLSGLTGDDVEVVPALDGGLEVVPGSLDAPGPGTVRTVQVEVETGLPVDGAVFADAVLATLNDPRGWGPSEGVTFERTDTDAELRVVLASPATTDALCAPLDTGGKYSCANAGAAVLNFDRWVNGAPDFGDDRETYRHYLVNHEVGHLLGHGHVDCPAEGDLAPVMVQQSMSTQGCEPNGWPNP